MVKMDKNPETGEWLCWIPETGYAWYIKGKKKAEDFVNELNSKFDSNEIRINPNTGKLEIIFRLE